MEDKFHVTWCPQELATREWDLAIKRLKQWFQESHTAHEIVKAIIQGLTQWHNVSTDSARLTLSFQEQALLGWDKLLDGWLIQSWREYQEQLWLNGCSHPSGKWWVVELIKKLWNVSWDIWVHWNGILHNSPMVQLQILEKGVNDKIIQLCESGSQLLPWTVLALMQKPQESILQLPMTVKQKWIELVEVAIQRKAQHKYDQYLSEQKYMASWVIYH